MNRVLQAAKSIVDTLYPPVCVNCRIRIPEQKVWLCGNCYDKLNYLPEQHCPKCGYPAEEAECFNCAENSYVFKQAISAFLYDEAAKALVHEMKYNGLKDIAEWFANQMYKVALNEKPFADVDYVTAVPLHRVRRRERGFNQSDLIARELASKMDKTYTDKALVRKTYTASQTILNSAARRKNLKDAFRAGSLKLTGKKVLLVDDVFTTGTTVNEAAKTLLQAGAEKVYVMTACHGL